MAGTEVAKGVATPVALSKERVELWCRTEFVPARYRGKPDDAMVAIDYGLELGMKPMQALQGVAVVNGRPTLYGDAMLGIVMASGLLASMREWMVSSDNRDQVAACCEVRRRGAPTAVLQTFSVGQAKKARLWAKKGSWAEHPTRMLQMRARAFALRDAFADVLTGLEPGVVGIDPGDGECVDTGAGEEPDEVDSDLAADLVAAAADIVGPPKTDEPIDLDKAKVRMGQWSDAILKATTVSQLETVGNGIGNDPTLTDDGRDNLRELYQIRHDEMTGHDAANG
jgi:hypothetical protein